MEMFGQVDLRATCPPDKKKFFVISSPVIAHWVIAKKSVLNNIERVKER